MLRMAVSHGNSAWAWNTTPLPRPGPVTATPSTSTSPAVASTSPAMMLSSVVLPQPLRPTSVTNSFSATASSMPSSTAAPPAVAS